MPSLVRFRGSGSGLNLDSGLSTIEKTPHPMGVIPGPWFALWVTAPPFSWPGQPPLVVTMTPLRCWPTPPASDLSVFLIMTSCFQIRFL